VAVLLLKSLSRLGGEKVLKADEVILLQVDELK
jgi:hypothetical protein